jgi:hypothetical protein
MTIADGAGTEPDVALTLVMPLRAKDGMSLPDFYDYWFNAHVTLPPRFPGISSVWLHTVSFPDSVWPPVAGAGNRPEPLDEFHGVPEATFPTMADLAAFQAASGVQMADGINFLSEMLAYPSVGAHSRTVVDSLDPAPDGHDNALRHLIFLRRRPEVPVEQLRRFVTETLAGAYASSPAVRKVRYHLLEAIEVALDHPGVVMSKPLERQYQVCLEVVLADQRALREFAGSAAWTGTVRQLAEHCEAVHAARVARCVTTIHNGRITLAGVRGVAVADLIGRLGAKSQRDPAVSRLFLPETVAPPGR